MVKKDIEIEQDNDNKNLLIGCDKNMGDKKDLIKQNKVLYLCALILLVYGIGELMDTIALIFIILGTISNEYVGLIHEDNIFAIILKSQPGYILPFFLGFTMIRLLSAIGMLKNRLWGFYLALSSLFLTIILDMFILPIGAIEIFMCLILMFLMFLGYFGNKPIIET